MYIENLCKVFLDGRDILPKTVQANFEDTPNSSSGLGYSISLYITNTWTNHGYGAYTNEQGQQSSSPLDVGNLGLGLMVMPYNPYTDPQGNPIPMAYLKVIHYDMNDHIIGFEYRMLDQHAQGVSNWQAMEITMTAKHAGRIEAFVVNESEVPVYFDNLQIEHITAPLVQENHYDPLGLQLTGISILPNPENRFTFNGFSEKQKDLAGNSYVYETDWRQYDPQLGRFHAPDKLEEWYIGVTPYHYALNNPMMFNDPSGLNPSGSSDDGMSIFEWMDMMEFDKVVITFISKSESEPVGISIPSFEPFYGFSGGGGISGSGGGITNINPPRITIDAAGKGPAVRINVSDDGSYEYIWPEGTTDDQKKDFQDKWDYFVNKMMQTQNGREDLNFIFNEMPTTYYFMRLNPRYSGKGVNARTYEFHPDDDGYEIEYTIDNNGNKFYTHAHTYIYNKRVKKQAKKHKTTYEEFMIFVMAVEIQHLRKEQIPLDRGFINNGGELSDAPMEVYRPIFNRALESYVQYINSNRGTISKDFFKKTTEKIGGFQYLSEPNKQTYKALGL